VAAARVVHFVALHSRRWSRDALRVAAVLATGWASLCGLSLLHEAGARPEIVAATVAFVALAAWQPAAALAGLALLTPVATILSSYAETNGPWTEGLVLAGLTGLSVRVALGLDEYAPTSRSRRPWLLLAALVLASAVVEIAVETIFIARSPSPVLHFLRTDYFTERAAYPPILAAALLLEGLMLFAWTSNTVRDERAWRLVAALLALSGVVAASLNLSRLIAIITRASLPPAEAIHHATTVRVNVLHGDVNAAGSYFVLLLALQCGLALRRKWHAAWALAAVPVAAALWLTGSRTALAVAAVIALTLLLSVAVSRTTRSIRILAALSLLAAVSVAAAGYRWYPEKFGGTPAVQALRVRHDMAITSLRMTAEYPVFGIGVGRFYSRSAEFMPPAVGAEYSRENAHNNYLQVLAELGLSGLVAFGWLLATVLVPQNDGVARGTEEEHETLAVRIGLVGFLFTCLMGHPLLVREVAYPFWIALGLVAARVAPMQPTAGAGKKRHQLVVFAGIVLILATMPFRVVQHSRDIDLEEVASGVSAWERDAGRTWVRHLSGSSTFYATDAPLVEIPLRLTDPGVATSVLIVLDGKPANMITLQDSEWVSVRVVLPSDRPHGRFRRIDVTVEPASSAVVMGRLRYP